MKINKPYTFKGEINDYPILEEYSIGDSANVARVQLTQRTPDPLEFVRRIETGPAYREMSIISSGDTYTHSHTTPTHTHCLYHTLVVISEVCVRLSEARVSRDSAHLCIAFTVVIVIYELYI